MVDNGYASDALAQLYETSWKSELIIAPRNKETRAFVPEPLRWKVERTFAWLGWYRLLTVEYERTIASSESAIYCASIRHLLRRIVNGAK